MTGFPPGVIVSGTIHNADELALQAQNGVTAAYNSLASQQCTQDLTGQDLGGRTLTAGVYCFSSTAGLTGTLTLNAQGNANAVFIFKVGSALTTASASSVSMINGGSLCNVFWQVGSSATLGTGSSFAGNILASASITLNTGASLAGRALARSGAVTLEANAVTAPCLTAAPPPTCPVITLLPATLPAGRVGSAYTQSITASGGTAPYSFSVSSGTLPAGLVLAQTGLLSGTPTTVGTSSVTIRATDANGCLATTTYSIVIAAATPPPAECPAVVLNPATLPGGQVGIAYTQQLTASGGTAPYSYGVVAGALPAGLVLSPQGLISGTPTTAATSGATIRATDANGCFVNVVYSIVIAAAQISPGGCPPITLTPASPPSAVVGSPYSLTLVGNGGTAPYRFGVISGAMPTGLSLTATGVISGTPTTPGIATFTVRGTDANGCFSDVVFRLAVNTAVPMLPTAFAGLLACGLAAFGYARLRLRA